MEKSGLSVEETNKNFDKYWQDWYVKGLSEFIEIPNLTPMVDPTYLTNGNVEKAMEHVDNYINKLEIKGIEKKVF